MYVTTNPTTTNPTTPTTPTTTTTTNTTTTSPTTPNNDLSDIFREAMVEVETEAKQQTQTATGSLDVSSTTVSFIHAPEILGHHVHFSTNNDSGESIFENSEVSELWAAPAVVPSDLSMEASMEASEEATASKSELWAEPAPIPSDYKSELWAEPAPIPSYLENESSVAWQTPKPTPRPQMLSSFSASPRRTLTQNEIGLGTLIDLEISPITNVVQELAPWDPD